MGSKWPSFDPRSVVEMKIRSRKADPHKPTDIEAVWSSLMGVPSSAARRDEFSRSEQAGFLERYFSGAFLRTMGAAVLRQSPDGRLRISDWHRAVMTEHERFMREEVDPRFEQRQAQGEVAARRMERSAGEPEEAERRKSEDAQKDERREFLERAERIDRLRRLNDAKAAELHRRRLEEREEAERRSRLEEEEAIRRKQQARNQERLRRAEERRAAEEAIRQTPEWQAETEALRRELEEARKRAKENPATQGTVIVPACPSCGRTLGGCKC